MIKIAVYHFLVHAQFNYSRQSNSTAYYLRALDRWVPG